MVNEIRKYIENLKNKTITIKVDVGRNRMEKYKGNILKTYSHVWTFKSNNGIKSFTYSDVISKNVIIGS